MWACRMTEEEITKLHRLAELLGCTLRDGVTYAVECALRRAETDTRR